jgi:curved DNA-binding protein CbpA
MPNHHKRAKEDPYKELNLPHTATDEEIKQSFRQLAKKYHPDTWSASCFTDAEKNHATSIFQRVSEAHALLKDPLQKAAYDRDFNLGAYPEHNREHNREHNHNSNSNNSNRNRNNSKAPLPLVRAPSKGAPPPLPWGWTTAIDPATGSLYYCHVSSGKSSWTHPSLVINSNSNSNSNENYYPSTSNSSGYATPLHQDDGYYSSDYDRTIRTSNEPETHRCGAFLALLLCPPLGILATIHSIMVDRCWSQRNLSTRTGNKSSNIHDNFGDECEGDPSIQNPRQHYEDLAHGHSKRAAAYACFGNGCGIIVWVYLLFGRDEEDEYEWQRNWKQNFEEWSRDWGFGDR